MGDKTYVIAEGETHLVNDAPDQPGEFTLCGDAFDLASDVAGYEWASKRGGPVTCHRCVNIIRLCRGVRT